jgi:hypothetical protein
MPKILKSNDKHIDEPSAVVFKEKQGNQYISKNINVMKYDISPYKVNIHFSKVEEYIDFLESELHKNVCLANISIEIWNKLNKYNYSKLTREKMDEFEKLFYLVLEEFQYYFNENNMSLINRWVNKRESRKFKISNDISFLIRYSENLLRYKYNFKRLLTYEKLQNIECI